MRPASPPEPEWRNGRRRGLKILRPQGRAGSTPASGTNLLPDLDPSRRPWRRLRSMGPPGADGRPTADGASETGREGLHPPVVLRLVEGGAVRLVPVDSPRGIDHLRRKPATCARMTRSRGVGADFRHGIASDRRVEGIAAAELLSSTLFYSILDRRLAANRKLRGISRAEPEPDEL